MAGALTCRRDPSPRPRFVQHARAGAAGRRRAQGRFEPGGGNEHLCSASAAGDVREPPQVRRSPGHRAGSRLSRCRLPSLLHFPPQPPHIRFSSPGKGLVHHPARGLVRSLGASRVAALLPRDRLPNTTGRRSLCGPWGGPYTGSRSVMKMSWLLRGIRICGGRGEAPTTTYMVLFSGQGAFTSPC